MFIVKLDYNESLVLTNTFAVLNDQVTTKINLVNSVGTKLFVIVKFHCIVKSLAELA